jgi:hypothetical protein
MLRFEIELYFSLLHDHPSSLPPSLPPSLPSSLRKPAAALDLLEGLDEEIWAGREAARAVVEATKAR